jgi:pentatricopeptide repeat protein
MVFAVLMDVAARSGRAEKAFELLTEMTHDAGVLPTSEVYRCAAPCVAPGQGGCDTADASDGLAPPPPPALSLRVFGRCEWSLYE